ncbi:DEAD/DEAH box helicase family protein [uncultured Cohaesibacter sp.]|uniref:DEAD/DEAH box helicase n=1 Tax=uncultured Cohaesibacter sp. TaxID=1002546 RepID=UPI0029314977|nr:DEAD/DEAH box helicase family protein [uncultured Cohaesibacter sp.]
MVAVDLELKNYQSLSLDRFRAYLQDVNQTGADVAFYKNTRLPYRTLPAVAEGTPYVCLRVPTGGGKTIMAAHSVGIAAKEFLQAPNPMVLWLVPSTPILEQTVSALKNVDHPYRAALAQDFGRNVSILTKAEALSMSRADAEGGACIIVSTIQSFRREDDKGKQNPEGLKVYEDNGALMDHFSGLKDEQLAELFMMEGTNRPVSSLANLLRLHRPMVIVDEAHNTHTALSFDTLSRFNPSLILELTATPQLEHDPAKDKYASNILYSVSAAELKAEQMIKMPIKLTTNSDWRKTIGAAFDCQAALEEAAKAEQAETGEYIRPIILLQAQSASKNDPNRLTWELIEKHLTEERSIRAEQIAVHTGPRKDLDNQDIADPDCPIRFVITVSKLKEGWDCPFAYVLCSVAEQSSATAIEQILGRVLRLPQAKWKQRDILNQAYAFVASANFNATAQSLKDGLVDGAGFDPLEADQIVQDAPTIPGLGEHDGNAVYESESFEDDDDLDAPEIETAISRLPASVRARVTFDTDKKVITYKGPMSRENRNTIQLALGTSAKATKIVDRLYAKSNQYQLSANAEGEKGAFIVPLLGFKSQGKLQLFTKDHFLDLPWRLDECDPSVIIEKFRVVDRSQSGQIDVSDKGKIEIEFVKRLQGELALVVQEPAWTLPRLANWLDSGIQHPDVTKPSAVKFVVGALEALINSGQTLDELARNKFELRKSLVSLIKELRLEREQENYSALFASNADQFATSSDLPLLFDEQSYAFNQPYKGATKFNKHYTPLIGDLQSSGEEFDCAVYLDQLEAVEFWIRNVENKKSSFWLQLPQHKFYPDFVVKLKDGRILVVEYKGAHLYEGESDKRLIGSVWADASGSKCLFCMPTNKEFSIIDRTIGK